MAAVHGIIFSVFCKCNQVLEQKFGRHPQGGIVIDDIISREPRFRENYTKTYVLTSSFSK